MEKKRLLHFLSLYEGSESNEDIEKQGQWMNEQLQKGYHCTKIRGVGIYTFEKLMSDM